MSLPRPKGVAALAVFFGAGAVIAGTAAIALLLPESDLGFLWQINPEAHAAFRTMGHWSVVLMVIVMAACTIAAVGLAIGATWGHRLALVLLVVNLIGDIGNAFIRSDLRTLLGLPISAALIAYLLSPRVRAHFDVKA